MSHRSFRLHASLTLLCIGICSGPAQATKIDTSPRPNIYLVKSQWFIAQDAWDSVALYGCGDGKLIHRFPAGAMINQIDVTADEQHLLIASGNGGIGVWEISSGNKLWWHSSSVSGLGYIYDASFSWNGTSLVACNHSDFAVVFDAGTGKRIGKVSFPPEQTSMISAALSPEGTRGAFVTLGERLFTFDTQTGMMRDTGLTGAWPVRYSADGKYIALRSKNSGSDEHLRIVGTKDLAKRDVGRFAHIRHIKPTPVGGFLACARGGDRYDGNVTVGVEFRPDSDGLKEVWKLPAADAENRTDFDPESMFGVTTSFQLVTRLIDLRTGKPRLTIDNSPNYRANLISSSSRGLDWLGANSALAFLAGAAAALVVTGCVVAYVLKSRGARLPRG